MFHINDFIKDKANTFFTDTHSRRRRYGVPIAHCLLPIVYSLLPIARIDVAPPVGNQSKPQTVFKYFEYEKSLFLPLKN
jgi:hypothetical protein